MLLTKELTDIVSSTSEIYTFCKTVFSSSLLGAAGIWAVKKLLAYLTQHHTNVTKDNQDRRTEINHKEETLISTTADERKQIFEMFKLMLEKQNEQNTNIKEHTLAVAEITKAITQHSGLLTNHTAFVSKVSHLMELEKQDFIHEVDTTLESNFSKYVDLLQSKTTSVKDSLRSKSNALDFVLNKVGEKLTIPLLSLSGEVAA